MDIELNNLKQTLKFAENIGKKIRIGDVIILSGNLGSGKTTFTKGLAKGIGVEGIISSPTFIIARKHLSIKDGPHLIHMDAYRLNSLIEFEDLDIESELDNSAIVVEWGKGFAEYLSNSCLNIDIELKKPLFAEKRLIKVNSQNSVYYQNVISEIINNSDEWTK